MNEGQIILLVDDQPEVLELARQVAEKTHLRLLEATDGQEGLDLALAERPDLILIRRNSRILDALSVTVLLKQSPKTRSIPVLVLCSEASVPERERFQDAGCDDFLVEPISTEDLRKKLESWLP